jgi:hypothetical protein
VAPSRPTRLDPPLPPAASDTLAPEAAPPPALAIDDDLKPPLLRTPAALTRPADPRSGSRPGAQSVELDVRVDESGAVTDALWAGGAADSALVSAAIECALGMRFYPALRAGRPVAVWCRQRFDFGRRD